MKTLVTGFEPFGSRNTNRSYEVAEGFKDRKGFDVMKLPVSFSRAHKILIDQLSRNNYEYLVMLGETSVRNNFISLERVALNLKDTISQDNDGESADEVLICPDGPIAVMCPVPLKKVYKNLKEEGYKVKISNSAGTFVCNCLYYNVLRFIKEQNLATQAVFVHVPHEIDFIDKEEMTQTIDAIITTIHSL